MCTPRALTARLFSQPARCYTTTALTRIAQDFESDLSREWLETDGLGGFASGTLALHRTRRYHALLTTATTPPGGRFVLWNGFDAHVTSGEDIRAISAQRYLPETISPDGHARLKYFESEPWPKFVFALEDGVQLIQEIFIPRGTSCVVVTFRLEGMLRDARLQVRPFISGRNYHALHQENSELDFSAVENDGIVGFQTYPSVPKLNFLSNGEYRHQPDWYRNFEYPEESARGLNSAEDLAAPGTFTFDLKREAILIAYAGDSFSLKSSDELPETLAVLRMHERTRRERLGGPLERAADHYPVARWIGPGRPESAESLALPSRDPRIGRTIIAGYPWFQDWGRDTFISIRGLCISTGRLDEALRILRAWAPFVSRGILPNRFPEDAGEPEYNSVDSALWFVIAVGHLFDAYWRKGTTLPTTDVQRFRVAIEEILTGYSEGTRHNIRLDSDGLIAAGELGLQLTWMDAKIGERVITPRIGKPVEIQALWLNALRIARYFSRRFDEVLARGLESFNAKFWNEVDQCLYDVIDEEHQPGQVDRSIRPNQLFAAGGLPLTIVESARAKKILETVEKKLLTPIGLRTLPQDDPRYVGRYQGSLEARDEAYHQGTVWPWLLGPFVEAWVKAHGKTPDAKTRARAQFIVPLQQHFSVAGIGHISELADGDAPHTPRGCPFQAWSLAELLRLEKEVLAP